MTRKKKVIKIRVTYEQVKNIPKEEVERRLNAVYDIIFDEVVEKKKQ